MNGDLRILLKTVLLRLAHFFVICLCSNLFSECAQNVLRVCFKCAQSVLRVRFKCDQSVLRMFSECAQIRPE